MSVAEEPEVEAEGAPKRQHRSRVPDVSTKSAEPIAVLSSDFHLSTSPPLFRAENEADWRLAQTMYLDQLRLLRDNGELYLFIAGDIFDKWNTPPEVINLAIGGFKGLGSNKPMAVPGNHDLAHKSSYMETAYAVLHCSGIIDDLDNKPQAIHTELFEGVQFVVGAAGYGQELKGLKQQHRQAPVRLAVVHDYCWQGDHSFPGAPPEKEVRAWEKRLIDLGYNCAVFGDNHKGFIYHGEIDIINTGTLIRRRSDEIDYKPMVGILHSDATIKPHYLDTRYDRFHAHAAEADLSTPSVMQDFYTLLNELGEVYTNFSDLLKRVSQSNDVPDGVKNKISEILEMVGKK